VREWLNDHLVCKGGTYPAQILLREMSDRACDRITDGINASDAAGKKILAVLDPYNPVGTTAVVNFTTSKELLWETSAEKCHVNYVVGDSEWELQFARAVEQHPRVVRYVKNQGLGFEVPYKVGGDSFSIK